MLLSEVGMHLFAYGNTFFVKLFLWIGRGSCYWEQKWLNEEANPTNKTYLRSYLKRNELDLLASLQGFLLHGELQKMSTKWEWFRLLAVMEAANNGSKFAQNMLLGYVSPLQAGKLGLAQLMDGVVGLFATAGHWRKDGIDVVLRHFKPETNDKETSECLTKVNKLF